MTLKEVSLADIDPGKRYRSQEQLNMSMMDLVPSIQQYGVLQSITVLQKSSVDAGIRNETNPTAQYLLLAGGRRYYASRLAGKQTIPARILAQAELALKPEELENSALVEMRVREIELEENIQRLDLDDHDKVMLTSEIHRLKQEKYGTEKDKLRPNSSKPGWSQADTAAILGKTKQAVGIDLMLAEAAKNDKEVADALRISKEEAKRVIKVKEKKEEINKAHAQVQQRIATTPEDVLKKRLMQSYVVGDAFELIKKEPDAEYNFVELDPDWGIDFKQSYDAEKREARPEDIEEYQEIAREDYEPQMKLYLREVFRVLKPNSWGILWFGNKDMKELNQRLLEEAGFKVDGMPLIWVKDLGAGFTRNTAYSLSYDYESAFYFRKGTANIRIDRQGRSNVFPFKRVAGAKKIHRTEKPIELYQEILDIFVPPASNILVGFAGSGNAILASANLGHTVKGFDLSEHFQKQFVLRVAMYPHAQYRSHEPGKARLF